MARIAVGGFQHETNTFAPQQATWEEFVRADAWPPLLRGPEMIAGVEGFNIPISGAVKRLAELGHEVVPLAWAAAAPASYVTEDAYEKMWALFDEDLKKLGPFDAVYLDLHGAMVAENTEDGEGELLRRIRGVVGNDLPIVASLDYHANLTPEMAKLATALVGYRTYPHIDMAVTGKRAVELLDRLLKEKRPVYRAYRQLDFLIPLVWQCTFIEPAKAIFDLVGELEAGEKSHNQGIVSVTHTPGFPPADIAQCGPALVVYGHDKEAVEAAADKLAQTVKAQEKAFAGELLDPDAAALRAIELSKKAKKPIVLADVQDNPGAGGTSDTVGLLAALMRHKAKGAVIGMIVDEEAAKAAVETGEGNVMHRGIGAVVGYAGEKPVVADWRVVKVGDGKFTGTGTDRNRYLGMLSYRTNQYTVAGEYVSVKNAAVTGSIISAFGVYHLAAPSKISLVARVDIFDPDNNVANNGNTRIIGGASYQLSPNVRLLADLDRVKGQGGATAINQFLIQAQFVF